MRYTLPDCSELGEDFFLTPAERRELLLLMAEKGEAGLQEFVRRHAKDDSRIAQKIERLRSRMEEEAADLRRRLESEYDERRRKERERARRLMDDLDRQEMELAARDRRLEETLPSDLEAHLRSLPLIEIAIQSPQGIPWWRRLGAWLRRLWTRLKRWIRRLFGRSRPQPKARGITVGIGAGPGIEVDMDLEQALATNPKFRRRIRKSLGATPWIRARRMMRILLGLDDYADVARRIMEKEAMQAAQERQEEFKRQRDDLTKRRRSIEEKERDTDRALDEELDRLRRVEAEEALKLDEVVKRRPRETAEHLVADELEAGGFLTRLGDSFEVTGRFLETVAGLVYAEESRGVSASHESPAGTSVDGEGILEKSPLRIQAETSHMDVVGSLVNARQRHPHVRHLTDDDLLVYRERRTSVSHVVVILDRSLSMEENNRMAAAKRAALALWWATKRKGGDNRIDFILMDTHVERATLSECWEAKPQGFTNTGRALDVARRILEQARANRRVLFLVTDGLPEALTIEGKDVAGRPEEALKYAMGHAARLARVPGLEFRVILLEPKDPLFVTAAEKIASKARGTVHEADPDDLARSLLRGLTETPPVTV